ncbi:tetratricopeptide repeat protein [Nonomuraea sp. NEAU-A123]|nr:tetratricopeptide repeat protein [Nonomuraea sp. NEAU-A123]
MRSTHIGSVGDVCPGLADHLDLGNLALSCRALGRSGEAVPLLEQASAITESARGSDHPDADKLRWHVD